MDIQTARRLVAGEGWDLLAALPPYDEATALSLGARLREGGIDPALVAAVMTQARLRARATDKFGEFAAGMLFTADGLEQATRLPVAARHAARFVAAGIEHVHDLGCGIGADAMGMASLDLAVHAVDADEVTALFAAANLRHFDDARVGTGRAEDQPVLDPHYEPHSREGVWFDPARRIPGVADSRGRTKRTFRLEELQPSWDLIRNAAGRVPATGAKLSPSLPHAAVPPGTEAQWTSWDGDVVECAVWWGPLVRTPGRTAAVLSSGGGAVVTEADAAHGLGAAPVLTLDDLGDHLHECDRAVVRAGLGAALSAAVDGRPVTEDGGYVTSSAASGPSWSRTYRIVEAMPLATKPLAAWLRSHDVTRVTIKKRGVDLDPDVLRRKLGVAGRTKGGNEAILVLTRIGGRQSALIVDPA